MKDHWGYEKQKPHWINESGRNRGTVFLCSWCGGRCYCISFGANKRINRCDYLYCPRCGAEMDTENQTRMEKVEVSE